MAQHNEIEFEKEIAEHLAAHGWLYSPDDTGYDKERALFPEDILGGWRTRSPTSWRKSSSWVRRTWRSSKGSCWTGSSRCSMCRWRTAAAR